MNIAILGATGQVGHAVREAASRRDGVTPVVVHREALDLGDLDRVEPVLGELAFDVLVNCAGYTAVDRAESEPEAAFRLNAYAAGHVALACAATGARLIHLSTDYVFDGDTDRPYRPDDRPGPLNTYGASKLEGEGRVQEAHGAGSLVVRTSSVFGLAGMKAGRGNFVETILRLGRERDSLKVVSDITMAPTYAADLAEALLTLVESDAAPGVYHITNAGRATWHEFALAILDIAGGEGAGEADHAGEAAPPAVAVDPVPAADYPSAARRPRYSVLDTGKAEEHIGPLPAWEDALGRYLSERE